MIGNITDKKVEVNLAKKIKSNKNQVKRADQRAKRVKRVKAVKKVIRVPRRRKIRRKDQILIDNKNIIYKHNHISIRVSSTNLLIHFLCPTS